MTLYPVPRPVVRCIAVSERTSTLWWAVMVGIAGGPTWALVIAGIFTLARGR